MSELIKYTFGNIQEKEFDFYKSLYLWLYCDFLILLFKHFNYSNVKFSDYNTYSEQRGNNL